MCRACIVFNQLEAWGISPSKFIRNVRRCSMCRTKRQINSGPTTGKCLVESLTQIFYFKFLLIGARYTKRERERLLRVCACAYDKFSVAVQLFFIEAMDCAFSHPASFPLTPALAVGHKEARSPLLCKHLLLKKQHGNSAPPPPPSHPGLLISGHSLSIDRMPPTRPHPPLLFMMSTRRAIDTLRSRDTLPGCYILSPWTVDLTAEQQITLGESDTIQIHFFQSHDLWPSSNTEFQRSGNGKKCFLNGSWKSQLRCLSWINSGGKMQFRTATRKSMCTCVSESGASTNWHQPHILHHY